MRTGAHNEDPGPQVTEVTPNAGNAQLDTPEKIVKALATMCPTCVRTRRGHGYDLRCQQQTQLAEIILSAKMYTQLKAVVAQVHAATPEEAEDVEGCYACMGSGEGVADTVCSTCGGTGAAPIDEEARYDAEQTLEAEREERDNEIT